MNNQRSRTNSLVALTLGTIIGLVPSPGCYRQIESQKPYEPPRLERKVNSPIPSSQRFENLLQEKHIPYDTKKLEFTWDFLTETEKENLYKSYSDGTEFYQTFNDEEKKAYDEFFKTGNINGKKALTEQERKLIKDNIGFESDLSEYKSPLSLAFFKSYYKGSSRASKGNK
jgi:hypothetical protein